VLRWLVVYSLFMNALGCDDSEERCRLAQEAVVEALDALDDSCESDDDCALDLVDVGECSEPLAARAGEFRGATELPALLRAKNEACPTGLATCEPPAGAAACREGRCVVVDPQ
jgi:hypothetical protein